MREYEGIVGEWAPVILLTAADDAIEDPGSISVDAVVPKPFDLDELLNVVKRLAG